MRTTSIKNIYLKEYELKKEIIKLKSLNRRAAEEIRDLDDILIDCVETNKVPKYDEKDPMFAGFSSINLLNRLDAKTSGGYIENYPDLCLKLKELDGWYKAEHPSFYQSVNKVIDDHKETLQKLADNPSPYKHKTKDCVYFQETGGMSCPDCDEEPFNEKSTSNEEHTPKCKWHKDWHTCDCGVFDNIMNKNDTNEQNNEQKCWTVKVEHLDATDPDRGMGELCVRLPDELMEQLGWEIGDEIEWRETEICEDWGEHKGLTLSNLTKNPKEI